MQELNSSHWSGVCAGGYFAAAAVYLGNGLALMTVRSADLPAALMLAGFSAACGLMGGLVLVGKRWAPKWAVVLAAAFAAIHLIGLAYLFLAAPASVPALERSLQWQLGASFFFLWLCVFGAAFRLVKSLGLSTAAM